MATIADKCAGELEARTTDAVLQVTREVRQSMDERLEQLAPFKDEMKAVAATMANHAQSMGEIRKVLRSWHFCCTVVPQISGWTVWTRSTQAVCLLLLVG
eukprot:COSAG05_NODE_1388_length_5007_cov_2.253260_7_plen_100_part_00